MKYFIFCLFLPVVLYAQQMPPCFRDLQTNFFSYEVMSGAFFLYNVHQSDWQPLYQAVQSNAALVPSIVQAKAARKIPNPLYPFQPQVAVQILLEAEFEIFAGVMRNYQSTQLYINDSLIRQMFNYIRERQNDRIARCLGLRPI